MEFFPLWCFLPILCLTAWWDLTRMRIPNALVLAGLAVFVVTIPAISMDELVFRLLAGLTTLAICFALFAFRVLGGGDAKIMPVVLLFVPADYLTVYLLGFSTAMVFGMVAIYVARLGYTAEHATWVSMRPNAGFPMGISIALSGLLLSFSPAFL